MSETSIEVKLRGVMCRKTGRKWVREEKQLEVGELKNGIMAR